MIKDEIFCILQSNYELRKVISDKIGTRIVNIERWAHRKSIPNWYKVQVIEVIGTELQLCKKDIEC